MKEGRRCLGQVPAQMAIGRREVLPKKSNISPGREEQGRTEGDVQCLALTGSAFFPHFSWWSCVGKPKELSEAARERAETFPG